MTTFFVCGDILNYSQPEGNICSAEMENIITSADYAVCNFEAPISGYGKPQQKSGKHHFTRPETIEGLKKHGFNLLLMANNHIMDYGTEAMKATMDRAQKYQLDTLGAGITAEEAYKPLIKEIKGIKFGMINACEAQFGVIDYFNRPNKAGYAWINHHLIDQNIINIRKECDFVIVFSHAGLENYYIPQKEWRSRYKHFCDLGADLVVGAHPHVPQGYEKYNKSLIFYSLGNFYFDSKKYIDKEDHSYALWLKFSKLNTPSFEPIYHLKKRKKVLICPPDNGVDLDKLNSLLETNYSYVCDKMNLEAFKSIKKNLTFSLMPIPYDGQFKSTVRRILNNLIGKAKQNKKELLLLHILRNESYYYAAKHALEVISREKYFQKNE